MIHIPDTWRGQRNEEKRSNAPASGHGGWSPFPLNHSSYDSDSDRAKWSSKTLHRPHELYFKLAQMVETGKANAEKINKGHKGGFAITQNTRLSSKKDYPQHVDRVYFCHGSAMGGLNEIFLFKVPAHI